MAIFGGSTSSRVVGGRRGRDQHKFGGHGAPPGNILLALTCLLVCLLVPKVDAGAYRGVSRRPNSKFFHCETDFFGSSPRKKIFLSSFEDDTAAALACDIAFFYTGRPSADFNFGWSEGLIPLICKHRSHYDNLGVDNWGGRRRFIKAQVNAFTHYVRKFRWQDVEIETEATDDGQVPTSHARSEWIAKRILHHYRNQPQRVPEFMAWFMEPATERRILEKIPSQTNDDVVLSGPEVDDLGHVHMNVNDIIRRVGSLEARPGRKLWLLLFYGSALWFIFDLFESRRAASGDTVLETGGPSNS